MATHDLDPIPTAVHKSTVVNTPRAIHTRFPSRQPSSFVLSERDLTAFTQGQLFDAYRCLGAQVCVRGGASGVHFAVWAPHADAVSVVGDFNEWVGHRHAAIRHESGVWQLFVPSLGAGERYMYRLHQGEATVDKSDPFGFAAELPPRTASKVASLDEFVWHDNDWLVRRQSQDLRKQPMSVYEVHLGSWKRTCPGRDTWLDYRALAHQLVDYCVDMGYSHLELLPVAEHPFTGSWGYQTVGYFAATSRFGSPHDFMYFVDYCHQHGIGVILDWVPAHFPRDEHGLARFDGTALFEYADPRLGEHQDWGTLIFDYGKKEVRSFLISNALFWLDKYHIDGLRVDAVASMLYLDYSRADGEWIPNEFGGRENLDAVSLMRELNHAIQHRHPGVVTVAEESTAWEGVTRPIEEGGLGFSMKWNMGWMNDSLKYFHHDPIHRRYHHHEITFSMIYAHAEHFMLPLSHDEVVHGKRALLDQMPGDIWHKFANLRLLYAYMWTHPGKKLLFMGCDFAQWIEWNHDDSLQWHLLQSRAHQGIQQLIRDLNRLYFHQPALYERDAETDGFEWIDCMNNESSVLAYLRKAKNRDHDLVVVANLTPMPQPEYRVGVHADGYYRELFNSDASIYGGSDRGNHPGRATRPVPAQGHLRSISVSLPPLGVVIFKKQ